MASTADAASVLFESLDSYARLQELIENGEVEGLHLECKAPHEPRLTKDMKKKLAESVSGFSNTGGGVILWGMSTTKHVHSGLDVLTQCEPLGSVRTFAQQVEVAIPGLTMPAVTNSKTKILLESEKASRGVAVTHIPQTKGDPIQSNHDHTFHFRNGHEFTVLPYVMIKGLFAASETPDLVVRINVQSVRIEGERWVIPIVIENRSSAVAEHGWVQVEIVSPSGCEAYTRGVRGGLPNVSHVYPGKQMFTGSVEAVVHRGLIIEMDELSVRMKTAEQPRRVLKLVLTVFANKMRAREWKLSLRLTANGFTIEQTEDRYLY